MKNVPKNYLLSEKVTKFVFSTTFWILASAFALLFAILAYNSFSMAYSTALFLLMTIVACTMSLFISFCFFKGIKNLIFQPQSI